MKRKGKLVSIHSIKLKDAKSVLQWENDIDNWFVSGTNSPYAIQDIIILIHSLKEIKKAGQARFIICTNESKEAIGTVDLFEIDFEKGVAGVGILIGEKKWRRNGFAFEALSLLEEIAVEELNLNKLMCSVHKTNFPSVHLFNKLSYDEIGMESERAKEENVPIILFEKWLKK